MDHFESFDPACPEFQLNADFVNVVNNHSTIVESILQLANCALLVVAEINEPTDSAAKAAADPLE